MVALGGGEEVMMNKIEHMEKQHKVLELFFKEYFKKSNIHFGYWLAAGLLLGFSGLIVLFPYQTMCGEDSAIMIMAGLIQLTGAELYFSAYRTFLNDRGMVTPLYSRLQYLPVSRDVLGKYCLKKAVRLQTKVYIGLQIGQLFFSIVTQHEVVWGNVLFPLLACWVIPCAFLLVYRLIVRE